MDDGPTLYMNGARAWSATLTRSLGCPLRLPLIFSWNHYNPGLTRIKIVLNFNPGLFCHSTPLPQKLVAGKQRPVCRLYSWKWQSRLGCTVFEMGDMYISIKSSWDVIRFHVCEITGSCGNIIWLLGNSGQINGGTLSHSYSGSQPWVPRCSWTESHRSLQH